MPRAANLTCLGLYALQHRGQESAGIATADGQRMWLSRAMGLVADNFDEATLASLTGAAAIGHVRYSTAGDSRLVNAQPILIDCAHGQVAICHNGELGQRRGVEERAGSPGIDLSDELRYGGHPSLICTNEVCHDRSGGR